MSKWQIFARENTWLLPVGYPLALDSLRSLTKDLSAIAFDVHLAEIFVPLALGMTLVSAKRGELLENLPPYINLLGITHVGLVPSLIDATMCAVEDERKGEGMKLRYIASGGEKITDSVSCVYRLIPGVLVLSAILSQILDKWADHPVVRLANFYG